MNSIDIIEKLIAFPTVSAVSNLELVGYVRQLFDDHRIKYKLLYSPDGQKANLFASTGLSDRPGVLLSGHSDVVPVAGQNWTKPPFALSQHDGRLYGRGTADMKGFVGCAIAAMLRASKRPLLAPLQLAMSFDEEIGCVGVRGLLEELAKETIKPAFCLIGEPTSMQVATGHKGKVAARVKFRGREGHSAMAPMALNAIHLASDFISALRHEQQVLQERGPHDEDYDVSYSTVHVGKIHAGVALNIVPAECDLEFEIRNVADEPADAILARLQARAREIEAAAAKVASEAKIEIEIVNAYPGLNTDRKTEAVGWLSRIVDNPQTIKVAFGTEGGLFADRLGVPAIVCGPGSMQQGHRPDEYVSLDQIQKCDAMLESLSAALESGAVVS